MKQQKTQNKQGFTCKMKREQLDDLLASAQLGYWSLNLETQMLDCSSLKKYTYDAFLEQIHPDDRAHVDDLFKTAIATKSNVEFECRISSLDAQSIRWIWIVCQYKSLQQKEYLSGLIQDITKIKAKGIEQNELLLRDSQRQLEGALRYNRDLIEANLNPMFAMSQSKIITDINHAAMLVLGLSYEKIIGTKFSAYFLKPDSIDEYCTDLLSSTSLKNQDVELLHASGKTQTFLLNASIFYTSNANELGILATLTDISGLKQALLETKTTLEKLTQANQQLKQFAYMTSHDLQEPLRSISNYLALIQRRYKDKFDKDANDFIDYAVEGANRLQQMIDSMLVFSRLETRAAPYTKTNLTTVLNRVIKQLSDSIKNNKAVITHDELPTLMVDELQIGICFQNLISNSIKFHKIGTPPKIHVSAVKKDHEWTFSVSDNGIGIDLKYKDQLFVMFKRLVGREYAGTGMGLAICKKIIQRYGGTIWVDSQLGKGSTFYFTIPNQGEIK